jgi:hypothetical protein
MSKSKSIHEQLTPAPRDCEGIHPNSQSIIDALPDPAKTPVLMSLVGKLNNHIINVAQSVVAKLSRDGVDVKDYSLHEVIHLMEEPDWRFDNLLNVRRAMSVRTNLRDQLFALTNDDSMGDIYSSIQYRTKPAPVADIDPAKAKAVLIANRIISVNASDAEVQAHCASAQAQRVLESINNASRTAGLIGNIEWVIDHVFNPDTGMEQNDNIEDLPRELRQSLFDAIATNIDKQRRLLVNELLYPPRNGKPRYLMNDSLLLADCADKAELLDAHVEEALID